VSESETDSSPPSLDALRDFIAEGDVLDRAFVDAELRRRWSRREIGRRDLTTMLAALEHAAASVHAETRAQIVSGALHGSALRAFLDAIPRAAQDQTIEGALPEGGVTYAPSGLEEIVFALDGTGAGPQTTFIDLGSGLGKVVMLATLLTGATSTGVEIDPSLASRSRDAALALGLSQVSILLGDARDVQLDADLVFMFVPFTGPILDRVLERIEAMPRRPRYLCSAPIDESKHRWLHGAERGRSWLQIHSVDPRR
jgi:hypothetical protein